MTRLQSLYTLIIWLACSGLVNAQPDTLGLSEVLDLADQTFTVAEDKTLYGEITHLKNRQLDLGQYPSFKLQGQTDYQSDVVSLPLDIPMQQGLDLPHLRSRVDLEVEQTILDGGIDELKKQNNKHALELEHDRIALRQEVLHEQLTELYFRCLLLQNMTSTLANSLQLLREKKSTLRAAIERGVRNETDVLELESEIIDLEQDSVQRTHQIQKLKDQIGQYLDRPVDEVQFILPKPEINPGDTFITDPKLTLISTQQEQLKTATDLSAGRKKPKLKAFARTGLGYPNPLNLFDDALSPYFIGGLRLSWTIWDWGRHDKERQIQALRSKLLRNKRDREQVRIRTRINAYKGDIDYLETALQKDEQLIRKRKHIRALKSAQLDKGVITTNDYLEAVHREQQAILLRHRHTIELVKAKVKFLLETGRDLNQ